MTITATVHEGKIDLPADVHWPSGTIVRIEPVEEQPPVARIEPVQEQPSTLLDLLKDFDGMADDLPPDFAENHDHYLYGVKRG